MEWHAFNPSTYEAEQADIYEYQASCLVEKIKKKMKNKQCTEKGKYLLSRLSKKDTKKKTVGFY